MSGATKPSVAIIIPVFKHSVFLGEAIESALAQEAPFGIVTLVVDDGCPFSETTTLGASYALDRDSVFYLRKPNGGLSSARNFGIEFALQKFPELEAVYFLDADNRITPNAIATAVGVLRENPHADWVYPNIDKFGAQWCGNYTAPYSRLLHIIFDNICEAGSLVSRRMLDAGCRFDEDMRAGMEDWDFWLQGIGKGFVGVNAPHFGFEYRFRGESMLSNTERERAAIATYIEKKHRGLFNSRALTAFEHEEAPRTAQILADTQDVRLFTDPAQPHETIGYDELLRRMRAESLEPDSFGAPEMLLWLPDAALAELLRTGLAATVLRALEKHINGYHFVAVRLLPKTSRIAMSLHHFDGRCVSAGYQGWAMRRTLFMDCVGDDSPDWVRSLKRRAPAPRVAELIVEGPFDVRAIAYPNRDATEALIGMIEQARVSDSRAQIGKGKVRRWNWREPYFPNQHERLRLLRHRLRTGILNPHRYREDRPQIGVALPIASFGGVEKVAFALASQLAEAGCDLHLFCFGAAEVRLLAGQAYPFKTTNFLFDPDFALWGGARPFMGHDLRVEHEAAAKTDDVSGLLAGLDVLICAHVAPLNAALGRLRRAGVKIVNHLHVLDETMARRSAGHPYLALGFEHVYDAILTCSQHLKAWLHGMGAPDEKLLVVHNAAGYAMTERQVGLALGRRKSPGLRDPLRAVFLGRLDEQKGVDRLVHAIRLTQAAGLNVRWRVIGSAVLNEDGGNDWITRLLELGVAVEPPVFDSEVLSEVYVQNDLFVLASRWEGAPLSIVEAQRLGCVPIATDVGAVSELIDDGVDGFVLPAHGVDVIAKAFVRRVRELDDNRQKLKTLRDNAIRRGGAANWRDNAAPVVDLMRRWLPEKFSRDGAARAQ
jgi:glycosyltransferase involved in cell wall biosynthesis